MSFDDAGPAAGGVEAQARVHPPNRVFYDIVSHSLAEGSDRDRGQRVLVIVMSEGHMEGIFLCRVWRSVRQGG